MRNSSSQSLADIEYSFRCFLSASGKESRDLIEGGGRYEGSRERNIGREGEEYREGGREGGGGGKEGGGGGGRYEGSR